MIIGISGKIGSGKDTVGAIIQHLTCNKGTNPYVYTMQCLKRTGFLPVATDTRSDWEIKKFAGKLKQIVAMLTGCRVEDLEDQKFKQQPLGKEWGTFVGTTATGPDITKQSKVYDNMTYRTLLQKVGTEAMRDVIHTNVWVNALFADYIRQATSILPSGSVVKSNYHHEMDAGNEDIFPFPNWIITDMRFPNEMDAVKERGGITIRVKRTQFLKKDSLPTHEHPSETALDNAEFDYVIDNDGTMDELVEKVKEILIKEKIIKHA